VALANAQKQAAHRERRAQRVAGLEQALAAERAETARLRRELATVEASLADALAGRGTEDGPGCRHPSEAVDGGTCQACGADVW
jgi:hypothetical protein